MAPRLDFLDPQYRVDPYPALARLRAEDPVHRDEYGIWVVTRYADVEALGTDPRMGRDYRSWRDYSLMRPFLAESALERLFESWLLSRDPPDHTRLRRLAAHAFTPRAIAAMRAAIERTADEVLTALADRDHIEFISEFAAPYPVRMIMAIMGLPFDIYPDLKRWSAALVTVLEPRRATESMLLANRTVDELQDYFRGEVAARQRRPTDDLIGWLVAAQEDGDRLSEQELLAMLVLLIFAGQVTTSNLIGNGLLALARHPGEMARLRADASLAPRAIEELLRFEAPTAMNARIAKEDVVVAGRQIGAGDMVLCMLSAANRDPEVFADPDRLDLSRSPNRHVAFGGGPHYCLGAPLARLESQVAFTRLLDRWSHVEVDESGVVWGDTVGLRGLDRLPVKVTLR